MNDQVNDQNAINSLASFKPWHAAPKFQKLVHEYLESKYEEKLLRKIEIAMFTGNISKEVAEKYKNLKQNPQFYHIETFEEC